MPYLWLKTLHIVLAIVAVGFSASYGLIIGRARKAGRAELTFALKTVQAMGDYVANPGFVLLFLTGFGMIRMSGLPMGTRWVHVSMALLFLAMGLGFGVAGPTLRKQIAVLEARGPDDPEFQSLSKRGAIVGGILGVLSLVVIYLMVHKPS
jgi:uncharacterized membrane protein